ncbi:MAG: hypothetical protein SFW09_18845 [Hyphomicrobiaceae bacterium]|nr:hypothetical protein [Hyphomicrobiaceae bacterium]
MLRKVASNWGLLVLTLLSTLLLLPINLHHVGAHAYGNWLVVQALTGYIYLLQLGLPMAVVRSFSVARAAQDASHMQRIIASHLAVNVGLAGIALMLVPLLLAFLDAGIRDNAAMLADARLALLLSVATIALTIVWQLPNAILSAYQEFERLNAIKAGITIAKVIFNLIAIHIHPSIVTVASTLLFAAALELICISVLAARVHRTLRIRASDFSFGELREALAVGGYAFLLSAGMQLAFHTSTLIVGLRLGAEHAAHYTIPMGLVLQFLAIIVGIAQVVMPVATELQAAGRRAELVDVLYRWTKIATALTCGASALLIVLGPEMIRLWLGPSMEPAGHVLRLTMVAMLLFLPVRGAALPLLMGLGEMARPTIAMLLAGIASVLLGLAAIDTFGIDGIVAANGIATSVLAVAIATMACRKLDISTEGYLAETMLRPLVGLAIVVGIGFILKSALHPAGVAGIVATAVCLGAVFVATWYVLVLRGDRHITLPSPGRMFRRIKGQPA